MEKSNNNKGTVVKRTEEADAFPISARATVKNSVIQNEHLTVTPLTEDEKEKDSAPALGPRNGGFEAWLQVASGFFLSMNSWGLINTYGVYQTYYFTTLLPTHSNSSISWIGSTQGFLLCVSTVIGGHLCDAGHTRLTLLIGSVLVVLGLMCTSLCTLYWQLMLAQGICVGLGSGCAFIASVAVIPKYFTSRKAVAIGISASGSSVGGVVYPILFHRLQPHVGFGWATRTIGFMALGTLAFSISTLRPKPRPRPDVNANSNINGTAPPSTGPTATTPHHRTRHLDLSAFRSPPFTLFSLAAFLSFIGLFIPFFYIEQYALTRSHLTPTLSFYTLPLLSAGSISGRIVPALLANRFGALPVLAVCTSVSAVLAFSWFALDSRGGGGDDAVGTGDAGAVAGIIVFTLLYGFFSGAFVSLRTVVVVSITPKSESHNLATRLGLNAFCAALGLLVGTPIAGILWRGGGSSTVEDVGGSTKGWNRVRGFCGGTIVLGACFVFLAAWVEVRGRKKAAL